MSRKNSAINLNLEQVKHVYRCAVDATASDSESLNWWENVANEVKSVCNASSIKSAAAVIEWWHQDWSSVGDSAKSAAIRMRQIARNI